MRSTLIRNQWEISKVEKVLTENNIDYVLKGQIFETKDSIGNVLFLQCIGTQFRVLGEEC